MADVDAQMQNLQKQLEYLKVEKRGLQEENDELKLQKKEAQDLY